MENSKFIILFRLLAVKRERRRSGPLLIPPGAGAREPGDCLEGRPVCLYGRVYRRHQHLYERLQTIERRGG